MAQEINDQEQAEKNTAEKPKGSRRTGSRKKAATAQESPADAAVVSPSQGEDKPKSVRRTRKSTKTADTAQNPDGEATASPKKTDSPVVTAEVSPAVHGEEQTSETDAPAKPRRTRSKKTSTDEGAASEGKVRPGSTADKDVQPLPVSPDGENKSDRESGLKKTTRRRSSRKSAAADSSAISETEIATPDNGSTEIHVSIPTPAATTDIARAQTDGEPSVDSGATSAKPTSRKRRVSPQRIADTAAQGSLMDIAAEEAPHTEKMAPERATNENSSSEADVAGRKRTASADRSEKSEQEESSTTGQETLSAFADRDGEKSSLPEAGPDEKRDDSAPESRQPRPESPLPRKAERQNTGASREARRPYPYDDDGVVTSILPALDEREQHYGNRNFRQNSYGNDHRRNNRNRPRSPKGQAAYGQDYPPILPGPMSYDDMSVLPGYGQGQDGKRQPRNRKRRPGQNGNTYDPYGQPPFTPPYPGYDPQYEDPDAILPVAQKMLNGQKDDLIEDLEDDGPQPALPGQPSLALPPSEDEEDLDALDEAVNGNRIQPRKPSKPQERKNDRKGRRDSRNDNWQDTRADSSSPAVMDAPIERDKTAEEEQSSMPALPPGTKRVLYVSVVPDEQVEVVITDNGQVAEYFVEMAHQAKIRGNIYKGVINNVDINLQAAFVNFGGGKNGFLQIDEVHPEYWLNHHDPSKGAKYPPIQKVLKNGQEVLVQVVKEPAGTKGAFLTTWISLAGRYLVLTPGQEQIGVSRKVEDPEERARLKELLAGIEPGEDMGVIIRTASEGASKSSIQKDLQYLKRLWKDIRKKGMTEKAPSLLYQEADLATRAVRDYLAEDIHEIWVDDEATQAAIRETTNLLFPRRTEMVKLHQDPRQTLWERFNLQRQLEEVTSREVVLPSGGRLVFDQTEALMAIDINSGKTQGKSNFESMVFRTNMEAAEAIARHLRLRDIGGQVVIDFIEMRDRNHCREVEKALRNAMRFDRARHDVGRMSSFGLLELVRQRTGTSAISISTEPCPFCHGTGLRRNMEWQALQSLREIQRKLGKISGQENKKKGEKNGDKAASLVYETDFELGMYLLNKKRDRLSELESKYNVHVEIQLKH